MTGLIRTLIVLLAVPVYAAGEPSWYGLTYVGQYSPKKYDEVPCSGNWHLKQQYLATAGVGREMARISQIGSLKTDLGVKIEALASHHWGRYDDYQEFAGSFNLRWHKFPWNTHLPTTLGHGIGLSYATVIPEQEVLYRRGQSAPSSGVHDVGRHVQPARPPGLGRVLPHPAPLRGLRHLPRDPRRRQ